MRRSDGARWDGMARRRLSLVVAAVLVAGMLVGGWMAAKATPAASGAALRYRNPVFNRPFPDPMVLRLGKHNYWAYGTSLGWQVGYFPILHSTDLVHWKYVGDAFKTFPGWGRGDFWAPDVVKRGGTYFLYYTALGDNGHCIGVATASRPQGPFKDHGPVGCGDAGGTGYIDPDLFIDRDGKAYLYVSVDAAEHHIAVIPMAPNLLERAGEAITLFGVTQKWESSPVFTTVEGPFLVRRGGTYLLFYSGNAFQARYAMGVATATSPTGPFTKCACNPILKGDRMVRGPGGGSVVKGPDGRLWMVYHGWTRKEGGPNDLRMLRIDRIRWKGTQPAVRVTP